MKSVPLLTVLLVAETASAHIYGALQVFKCCRKGEQLNFEGKTCVQRSGRSVEEVKSEIFSPLMNASDAYWVPSSLRTMELHVTYNLAPREYEDFLYAVVGADDTMVWRFLKVENTLRKYELKHFDFPIYSYAVWFQSYCFDATENENMPLVIFTMVKLRTLFKCCSKGEVLNEDAKSCVPATESVVHHTREEILNPKEHSNNLKWLPKRLQISTIRVKYNRGPSSGWNMLVNADNDKSWQIENNRDLDWQYTMRIVSQNDSKDPVSITKTYCFDEMSNGMSTQRVLLALSTNITKCCKKGEYFNSQAIQCVSYPGIAIQDLDYEEIYPQKEDTIDYWIPTALRKIRMTARYKYKWYQFGHIVLPAEEQRGLQIEYKEHDEPTLSLHIPTPSGKLRTVSSTSFCFEAVSDGPLSPRVLIATLCYSGVTCFPKCCQTGELLSYSGNNDLVCKTNYGDDWSPFNSSITKLLDPDKAYATEIYTHSLCMRYSYKMENVASSGEFFNRLKKNAIENERFSTKYFCADLLRGKDGEQEILASCELPPSASLYVKVRPLQMLAVVLLLLAIMAVLSRNTRCTTHGRALVCHALCLAAANALQAVWFFTYERESNCANFAYSIYFFLLAGGFWLNIISINMAWGFRQPLRALASGCGSGGGSGGGAASGWRRFLLLSTYAWGCPVALSAFTIFMDVHEGAMGERGFVMPTFFETRTCYFEYVSTAISQSGEVLRSDNQLGTLVYYYAPSAILVIVNAICLVLTLCRISELRKDSSLLGGKPHSHHSAVLYVKLLLTAGVAELLLEGTVWAARQRRYFGQWLWKGDYSAETGFVFAVAATFIDVARAAAVLWLCVGRWRWRCQWTRRLQRWRRRRCHPEVTEGPAPLELACAARHAGNGAVARKELSSTGL